MPRRHVPRKTPRKKRVRPSWRARVARFWPSKRARRRLLRQFRATPPAAQVVTVVLLLIAVWAMVNGVYQVFRKPAELFYPISGALLKTPAETWRAYGSVFRAHSTEVITPELLAALAQVEGSGNPVAHTPWQWYATWDLLEIYRPASSAVGMYQITDGTFAEARRYCIHRHTVAEDGPWYAPTTCWFNNLYSRVIPTHAAEMTSAFLERRVTAILERQRVTAATLQQKQNLAAIIHLCGAGAGNAYAARGFRLNKNQHCGDQNARAYLGRVNALKKVFAAYRNG